VLANEHVIHHLKTLVEEILVTECHVFLLVLNK